MIYLLLAVISSMMVSVLMRLSETRIHNNVSMLACNYLMCTGLAALYAKAMPSSQEGIASDCQRSHFASLDCSRLNGHKKKGLS